MSPAASISSIRSSPLRRRAPPLPTSTATGTSISPAASARSTRAPTIPRGWSWAGSRARGEGFGPLAPEVYRSPFPYVYRSSSGSAAKTAASCVQAFRRLVDKVGADRVAATIMEPVQGEGGFVVPPAAFVQGVSAYCRTRNILFIADEIQTGFYRTGRRFGIEHFDVVP